MILHTYKRGDEAPGIDLPWETADGTPLDLSSGYTFTLQLLPASGDPVEPDATIEGYDGGVRWSVWAADDLDIAPGVYVIDLTANETATGKDRSYAKSRPRKIHVI